MSRHLDGSIKPVDPLWYRRDERLRVRCGACGHAAAAPLGDWERRHRLPADTRLWRIVDRLRCSRCGSRPAAVEIGGPPPGGAP